MAAHSTPYLSIVVTTRNDNHGGDLLRRTTCFVNGLLQQTRNFQLPTELIVVEWNPPAGKPLLHEVLPKPANDDFLQIRYIVVPPELHNQFRHAQTIPLYQMIAKNVGIRRAKGEFVLCTNIDILFSDACFARLAQRNLQTGAFYRANRRDIPKSVMELETVVSQLTFARNNIIRTLGMNGIPIYLKGIPPFFFGFPNALKMVDRIYGLFVRKPLQVTLVHHLDMNACGDFTLMAKTDWEKIKGYVELDMYSIHIDSMGLMSATAAGMSQVVFKPEEAVYHIDHEDGWESEDAFRLIRFLESKPCLEWSIVAKAGQKLMAEKREWGFNTEDWGFYSQTLQEFAFMPA